MNPQPPLEPGGHTPPHLAHQPGVPLTREELVEIGFVAVEEEQYAAPAPPANTPPAAVVVTPASGQPPSPLPPALPAASQPAPPEAEASVQSAEAPLPPVAAAPSATVEPMSFSANTQHLKGIGRLQTLSIALYLLIFILAAAMVGGGWLLYTSLSKGA